MADNDDRYELDIGKLCQMHLLHLSHFKQAYSSDCVLHLVSFIDTDVGRFPSSADVLNYFEHHLLPIVGDRCRNFKFDLQITAETDDSAERFIPSLFRFAAISRCATLSINIQNISIYTAHYGLPLSTDFDESWSETITSISNWLFHGESNTEKRSLFVQFDFSDNDLITRIKSIGQLCDKLEVCCH